MLSALSDTIAALASTRRRETATWLLVVIVAGYAVLVAGQLLLGLLTCLLVLGCSFLVRVADPPEGVVAALGRPRAALLGGVSAIILGYGLVVWTDLLGVAFVVALLWFVVLLFLPGGLVATVADTVRTVRRLDERLARLEGRLDERESGGNADADADADD